MGRNFRRYSGSISHERLDGRTRAKRSLPQYNKLFDVVHSDNRIKSFKASRSSGLGAVIFQRLGPLGVVVIAELFKLPRWPEGTWNGDGKLESDECVKSSDRQPHLLNWHHVLSVAHHHQSLPPSSIALRRRLPRWISLAGLVHSLPINAMMPTSLSLAGEEALPDNPTSHRTITLHFPRKTSPINTRTRGSSRWPTGAHLTPHPTP
jgi:hypothetical protein